MNHHDDNPPSNELPPGVPEGKLIEAVKSSGYPLQSLVARELASEFRVVEEWGYSDRTEKTHRALDVYAYRELQSGRGSLKPRLHLLAECKRSDLPFVFFVPGADRKALGFPEILACSTRYEIQVEKGYRYVSASEFFCASELPFVSSGATISTSFTRADRKGDGFELTGVSFNKVVLPLASALEHMRVVFHTPSESPLIILTICVVDAPMVVARGTPEDSNLTAEPWVRVVHQEAIWERDHWVIRNYAVDFVHRQYLRKYVDEHAIPFAESLAGRMSQYHAAHPSNGPHQRPEKSTWPQFSGSGA